MNNYILEMESVKKSFLKKHDKKLTTNDDRYNIIDDLSMAIERTKITALIGGNGAGKTTLFNVITGFTPSDAGKIFFNKNNKICINNLKPYNIIRLGIGRQFQDNHIFSNMSILENMMIADSNRYGEKPFISLIQKRQVSQCEAERIKRIKKIFSGLFGKNNPFWEKRNEPASSLSYGQQRLLSLSRLLMGNYSLLLLDEPTSGINPDFIREIIRIIKLLTVNKKLTVFLIEHNMKFVLEVADYCNFMSHGKITAFGTPKDVIGDSEVRRTYLGA